jgi:hypothetical protein
VSSYATALLCYGFMLPPEAAERCRDDAYHSWNREWNEQFLPPLNPQWERFSPEWERWRSEVQRYEQSDGRFVRVDWYGTDDEPHYFVHIKSVGLNIDDDVDLPLPVVSPLPAPSSTPLFHFCSRFNLPYSPPGWFLCARYL